MRYKASLLILCVLTSLSSTARAQLFWSPPDFSGEPVRGDEPGLGLPLLDMTPTERDAYLLWNMRAGLNVAALQCQFSPMLLTVRNYNDLLGNHREELTRAYTTMGAYFKRQAGKKSGTAASQNALDQFTTRTYNGFSTMHAQLGFCQTASDIGREALTRPKGTLLVTAQTRMRELRNSLVPKGDQAMAIANFVPAPVPTAPDPCWDYRKDRPKKKC